MASDNLPKGHQGIAASGYLQPAKRFKLHIVERALVCLRADLALRRRGKGRHSAERSNARRSWMSISSPRPCRAWAYRPSVDLGGGGEPHFTERIRTSTPQRATTSIPPHRGRSRHAESGRRRRRSAALAIDINNHEPILPPSSAKPRRARGVAARPRRRRSAPGLTSRDTHSVRRTRRRGFLHPPLARSILQTAHSRGLPFATPSACFVRPAGSRRPCRSNDATSRRCL